MSIEYSDIQLAPIAIVGIGCRFPGNVVDEKSFWNLLSKGMDASSEIPLSRWDAEQYYDPNPAIIGKMYTKRGSFVENVDQFDPLFFNISGREAQFMDPQQRLLLEVCHEAIEKSGISLQELKQL